MNKYVAIYITAPNEEEGEAIARALVEESLCACASIIPSVRSIYRWEGNICDEREVLLIAKTLSLMAPIVIDRVKALHSYKVPEIVCVPIVTGSGEYLDWVSDSVDSPASEGADF